MSVLVDTMVKLCCPIPILGGLQAITDPFVGLVWGGWDLIAYGLRLTVDVNMMAIQLHVLAGQYTKMEAKSPTEERRLHIVLTLLIGGRDSPARKRKESLVILSRTKSCPSVTVLIH